MSVDPLPGQELLDPRRWAALALLCTAFLVVVLSSTIVFAAAPSMAAGLGFAEGDVQWVFTAAALTAGGLLFLGGRLADLLGRRRMFMTGIGLFTLSSMLCGLAWSDAALIGARILQGASVAVLTPAALALVTTTFPPGPERNTALGVWSMIGGVGATAGLLVGGAVTDAFGWRWIFMLNAPVGVAVLVLCPLLIARNRPERDSRMRGFDLLGAVTITGALFALVHAVTQVPRVGWTSIQTVGLLAASLALLGVFAVVETRAAAPLLPLRILRNRALVAGNVVMLQFGLTLAVMTVASVGGSYVAQHVVTRAGFRLVGCIGTTLIGLACLLLSQVSPDSGLATVLLPGLVLFGLGMGGAFVAGAIASLTGVSEHDTGVAAGLQNTSFTIGTAIGVAVLSTVATAHTAAVRAGALATTPALLTAGYQAAFGAAAVLAVAGLAGALALPHHRTEAAEDMS